MLFPIAYTKGQLQATSDFRTLKMANKVLQRKDLWQNHEGWNEIPKAHLFTSSVTAYICRWEEDKEFPLQADYLD